MTYQIKSVTFKLVKKIIGDIKNHNAPVKKSLRSYKLFQRGNLVMLQYQKSAYGFA